MVTTDDVHAALSGRLLHLLGDGQREQVVARQDGHALHAAGLLFHHVGEWLGQRVIGREGAEQVFVTLIVDLHRGGGRRDGRHFVLLGDAGGGLGGARAEGREKEVHLVLGDQAFGGLHGARRVRLVVDIDDLDLHALAADIDAAGLVGGFRPQVVALLLLGRIRRERPGQRQRRAYADHVLGGRGACGQYCGEQCGCEQGVLHGVPPGSGWRIGRVESSKACAGTTVLQRQRTVAKIRT
jgi:hypothetical protein